MPDAATVKAIVDGGIGVVAVFALTLALVGARRSKRHGLACAKEELREIEHNLRHIEDGHPELAQDDMERRRAVLVDRLEAKE